MTQEAPERTGNALFIAVLNVAAFLPLDEFYAEVAGFVEWVKSCPPAPGVAEVLLPGERAHQRLQARRRDGLHVDEKAWAEIGALAARVGSGTANAGGRSIRMIHRWRRWTQNSSHRLGTNYFKN